MAYAQTSLFVENFHGDCNIVDMEICTADVYFVDSTATNAGDTAYHGRSREKPFATLAYAVTQTTTNVGDFIIVGPNHAETIAAADDINFATATANGVTVIGVIGHGCQMPTFTFNGVIGADIEIDAHSVTLKNLKFVNTQDGLTAAIDVNNAWCTIENCVFEDDGTDNTVLWIAADANADYLVVKGCFNNGTDTGGNTAWISVGATDHVRIEGNQSNGDFSAGNIQATAAPTDILIRNNWLENANAVDVNIELFAAATGFVTRNYCKLATDTQLTWLNTQGNVMVGENYGVNDDGECGMLIAPGGVSV